MLEVTEGNLFCNFADVLIRCNLPFKDLNGVKATQTFWVLRRFTPREKN